MQVRADDLADHLQRGVAPLYVVHGDEPLLALEAGDAIRAGARRAGCTEREVLVVESGFKWDGLL
ncbi:MAG: DNA polymerase III subunit delta, partial [Betaproteobacteria bacterium]|nr:DNA polymerase III subunit delta [Betaproteobacteria bacterium]